MKCSDETDSMNWHEFVTKTLLEVCKLFVRPWCLSTRLDTVINDTVHLERHKADFFVWRDDSIVANYGWRNSHIAMSSTSKREFWSEGCCGGESAVMSCLL